MKKSLLIAVGGNSLIRAGQKGTIPEQFANAHLVCERIAELAAAGYQIVVTHGNGPQVGSQLLRSEAGSSQTYTVPLDVCVAMTQGEIGYILQTTLQSIFRERGMSVSVVALITQVLVNAGDAAFQRSTKPVGPFYSEQAARRKHDELGWEIVEDAARGYRRVVPSPHPCSILELDVIHDCLSRSMIVIAAGGGGIPVVRTNGTIHGVEAVIDKDRASALLACQLGLERLVISTDVERVQLNFKTPLQQPLDSISVAEAREFIDDGQFQEGSMRPKIEAAIEFLEGGGGEVIITDPVHITEALDGRAGTHIRRGSVL
jgi:carbamate kinase